MHGQTGLALFIFSRCKKFPEAGAMPPAFIRLQLFHSPVVTSDLASKTESAEHEEGGSAGGSRGAALSPLFSGFYPQVTDP